jgi:nicotinate-nucleotide pyrophosphorylase (carboxylating)
VNDLIQIAFKEDLPSGDITTDSLLVDNKFGFAKVIAKQDFILSGQEIFDSSLHFIDNKLECTWHFKNGDSILKGQTLVLISGNLVNLIKAERVALNFLGYLSGIATQTQEFVKACQGTSTKILDTRKTLPGYRQLVKNAVKDGGGSNHRMSLSDAILIKENHVALAGGIGIAIDTIKKNTNKEIEVETQNLDDVKVAVSFNVSRIMLDNMDINLTKKALELIPKHIKTEASGNMTLERISQVAKTGVDFISVGSLSHSVKNVDLSMLFDWS